MLTLWTGTSEELVLAYKVRIRLVFGLGRWILPNSCKLQSVWKMPNMLFYVRLYTRLSLHNSFYGLRFPDILCAVRCSVDKINVLCVSGKCCWLSQKSCWLLLFCFRFCVSWCRKHQDISAYLRYIFTCDGDWQTRPNLLLGLVYCQCLRQMLGSWMDGHISCQCLCLIWCINVYFRVVYDFFYANV